MYTNFYGFKEKPFNVTPDASFFYPSRMHEDALNSLYYAITEKRGFTVLTGNIGTGKTTMWRAVLEKLGHKAKTAVITNTHLTCKQLIAAVLDEIKAGNNRLSKGQMISVLNTHLIDEFSRGNNFILIIDEAQNLASSVLEEVRMLSNIETGKEKLIQIVLVGQTEFRQKLMSKELTQLRQRITVSIHLDALTREEAGKYIKHRINKARDNANNADIFTDKAINKIYEYSKGVPRLINSLCDGALLSGYAGSQKIIDESTLEGAVKEFLSFACDAEETLCV